MNNYVIDENDKIIIDVPEQNININQIVLDYSNIPPDEFEFGVDFLEQQGGEMSIDDIRPKSVINNGKKIIKDVVVRENIDVTKKVLNIKKDTEGKVVGKITTIENDATRPRGDLSRDNDVVPVIDNNNNNYEELTENSDDDYVYMVDIDPNEVMNGMQVVIDRDAVLATNDHVVNKRLQRNDTYTVSSLMEDGSKQGLDKTSTIVVDVDQPDITQISNHLIESNGLQEIVIPNGYDAVDSILVNVQVPSNNELVTTNNLLVTNNHQYSVSDLMSINSTKDGLSKNATFTVQIPSDVDNADVDSQNNNQIVSNGTYTVPNNKTGWNDFSVQVPSNNESSTTQAITTVGQHTISELIPGSTKDGVDKNATFNVSISYDNSGSSFPVIISIIRVADGASTGDTIFNTYDMTFKPTDQSVTVTVPYHCAFVVIQEQNDQYAIYYLYNNYGQSLNRTISAIYNARYYVTDTISNQTSPTCKFYDRNGGEVFYIFDSSGTDTAYTVVYLKKSYFDFLWINN